MNVYRVLYRKWRPQVFSDVVGQPHITKTLLSEVRENRLAHAYLFTGSRGTGKTTCAKILSKAINCLHPVDGNPCNECEMCRGIDSGTVLDIVEIDAASNRGIDDIRQLRDESGFTPSQAKYRVYIIDEVHMLTIEAFNALLKTLEEPPEHVKFILATTEVHKLPSTILSRCQRFDFRRIEPAIIAQRLMYVAKEENAVLSEDAAILIARIADGGMRDALSLLDSAISVSDNVTSKVVSDCAGLMGREFIYDLIRAVAAFDTAKSLSILDELHKASCDTERLINELTNQFRNFLIIKTVKQPENLIVSTADELEVIRELASSFTDEQLIFALNTLTSAADAVKRTQNRRIEAEMALIKLCSPETDNDISALNARIAKLEKEIALLKQGGTSISSPAKREDPVFSPSDVSEPGDDFPFEGFSQDTSPGEYSAAFSEEETDDEPFDFDAFMRENQNKTAPVENKSIIPASEKIEPDEPKPVNRVQTADGAVDKHRWVNVIYEVEKTFKPLTGMLAGSQARISGDVLIVRPAEPKLRMFFDDAFIASKISPCAEAVLGKHYDIKLEYN
ncbi:MAG: DNA polymerase III subunit gamma/tau [Oscillospiraceae bacterium]|nr:DNA polymerase III subunit gamma/tau [Oscillospiraceae bacterium]